MGYYIALMLLPILAILENSVLLDLRLLDGQPSLVLVAVIAWSWHSDLLEAIFWAFVGGIALDLLNPIVPTGVSIITMLTMIFAVKTIERVFYQVSIFTLIAFVIGGTILHHLTLLLVFNTQSINISIAGYVQEYSIPTLLFNMIGTFPMYWVLRRIQKRIPHRQSSWVVTPR